MNYLNLTILYHESILVLTCYIEMLARGAVDE